LTAATAAATPAADDDDDDIWDVAIAPESGSFATASTTLKPLNALCARHATDVGLSEGDISSICANSSSPAFDMFLHFLNDNASDEAFGMSSGNLTPLYLGFTKNARLKFSGSGPNFFWIV